MIGASRYMIGMSPYVYSSFKFLSKSGTGKSSDLILTVLTACRQRIGKDRGRTLSDSEVEGMGP